MSLKAFHILFIALSILLALGVGSWGVQRYLQDGEAAGLALGAVFFLGGAAMVVYGLRFFRKLARLR